MWDFLPVNLNEIKQVEVIRGPASAVWGANALNGVVNVITKSPREMQGTSAVLGFGGFDREPAHRTQHGRGHAVVRQRHARAGDQRPRGVQASAGGYSQDALARPTGAIPCDRAEVCAARAQGLSAVHQPGDDAAEVRHAARLRLSGRRKLTFSGGVAGTDGIMHTGSGRSTSTTAR